MEYNRNLLPVLITGILALFCCCLIVVGAVVVFGFTGLQYFQNPSQSISSPTEALGAFDTPTSTPQLIRPTQLLQPTTIPQTPELSTTATIPPTTESLLSETLALLENTIVPINDPIELAQRLEGKTGLSTNLETPPVLLQVGAEQDFWITNSDTNENLQVQATLRYTTDHVYFWVQNSISFNARNLRTLVDTFENKIYSTNREFFGSEWTPGVDNDHHLYILYARGIGSNVAGYFSTADEYLPDVREYSNAHEMFILSADHVDLGENYAYSVLAHEFQHMIHWYLDRNEETWMNEGFSNVAAFLNGYDVGGSDYMYTRDPDMQLTDWPTTPENRAAHYGASFLFLTYFLDRFGEQATQAVVADPANGMVSIDNVLESLEITDPVTSHPVRADDVFVDWVVASYLRDPQVGDGRFNYNNYPSAPGPTATESIRTCPQGDQLRDVSQYGADYIRITCQGNFTLHFEGSMLTTVLPVDAFSGKYAFYSNSGDESDMSLTQSFDFTNQTAPLTLSYWTWYDLEKDYDYLYLLASEDGDHWQILTTPSGTDEDPSGNSYGWAYNGFSGNGPEWIQESVNLSQFAGKQVQLRFEYITDAAVNGEGFLIDDISIPEINYFTDFETDNGGWQADGFVRIENILPQFFRLSLISIGNTITVTPITLNRDNLVDIPISIGSDVKEVILVVSGLTRFTRQKAVYQFNIQP